MKAQAVDYMDSASQPAADLEQVFREHHAAVFRAAYRITGNADDAEDVLQTVFLRLVKRDSGAEPIDNLPSFLHRAAVIQLNGNLPVPLDAGHGINNNLTTHVFLIFDF
jgi:hypothetical protein